MASTLPTLKSPDLLRISKLAGKALREAKKVNPRYRYVMLCPSPDSAHVGMARRLLDTISAKNVFEKASEILNKDILKLCLEGPKSDILDSMENRYIATFVTSHATINMLREREENVIELCKAVGGIGIGFVNALVHSEAMTFEDGLEFVQKQGNAIDMTTRVVPNARVSIRVKPATGKQKICRAAIEHCLELGIPQEIAVCSVSKQSMAQIIEVAGHEEAIKYLETEGKRLFGFRAIRRVLKTPNAVHTDLMYPVSDFLKLYIEQKIESNSNYLKEPETCSVYSATAGRRLRSLDNIKRDLYKHPKQPLKVEQLIHCMFARPKTLAQPNIIVLWDRQLLRILGFVNRPARDSARLVGA